MSDIVERLRKENSLAGHYAPPALQIEAADEIERLRAALLRMTAIIETQAEPDIDALHDVARAALGGSNGCK